MKGPPELPALPPMTPAQTIVRLHCLALAVERRMAGDAADKIMAVAEQFYSWVSDAKEAAGK